MAYNPESGSAAYNRQAQAQLDQQLKYAQTQAELNKLNTTDPNGVYDWGKSASKAGGGVAQQAPTLLQANYTQQQFDPWSAYRAQKGAELAESSQNDPSNIYRDRLAAMTAPGGGAEFATSDPSYEFRLKQGQQALERSGAAKGLLNSGNMAIALQDYGQNAASQEYGAQFDRLLKGMSGVSQQYDMQQRRLMEMAGVNLDPTSAAKLNLGIEGENTTRMANANNYNLGMTNAANNRYATDVNASTSLKTASRGGMIDTQSLYAGEAKDDVYSANWWADANKSQGLSAVGAGGGVGSVNSFWGYGN